MRSHDVKIMAARPASDSLCSPTVVSGTVCCPEAWILLQFQHYHNNTFLWFKSSFHLTKGLDCQTPEHEQLYTSWLGIKSSKFKLRSGTFCSETEFNIWSDSRCYRFEVSQWCSCGLGAYDMFITCMITQTTSFCSVCLHPHKQKFKLNIAIIVTVNSFCHDIHGVKICL